MLKTKTITTITTLFLSIQLFSQKISTEDRIYGLSKFWQETNYNFAYFENVPNLDFDSLYRAYIPQVIATKNDYEYYRLLQRFCASLKDGHTGVHLPQELYDSLFYPPIRIRQINNEAIIINVGKTYKGIIPRGSKIIAVDSMPTRQYLEKVVYPYISAPLHIVTSRGTQLMLKGFKGSTKQITIVTPQKEQKKITVHLNGRSEDWHYPYTKRNTDNNIEFKQLENKIGYIIINSFADSSVFVAFKNILPKLYKQEKLIIDIRFNTGGNSSIANEIVKYFTNAPYFFGTQGSTRKHLASYKAWGAFNDSDYVKSIGFNLWPNEYGDYFYDNVWEMEPQDTIKNNVSAKKLLMPLVVLIGNNTASAAEDFLISLDNVKRGTLIGQKTYGSTGQPIIYPLPNGGFFRVCTRKCTYPDGRKFIGTGIEPDIEISPTLEFFLSGDDITLKKAIEYLEKN